MLRTAARLCALVALAALGAVSCSPASTGSELSQGAAQQVAVAIAPDRAGLVPGETLQLAAAVTGTANTAVTWSVVEAGGGSVSSSGLYTAPSSLGTFHVRVTSQANTVAYADAEMSVTSAPVVVVAIGPTSASVLLNGSQAFTATVTGSTNHGVTWKVQEASGCGSVSAAGVYTAPGSPATCHVVATSQADTTKSATATVTVTAVPVVNVAIAPTSGAVDACKTIAFTATVTGSSNTAVTWSVVEGTTGGTVSSGGVYTAPATAGTYHVKATSQADASKSATAAVTVSDHILSVAVAPTSASVTTGGTYQFSATVTTTCGAFQATP